MMESTDLSTLVVIPGDDLQFLFTFWHAPGSVLVGGLVFC